MSWYMWGEQQTAFKSQSSPTMRTELRSPSLSAGSKSLYSLSCLIRQKILLHFILNQTGRIVDEIKGVYNNLDLVMKTTGLEEVRQYVLVLLVCACVWG